MKHHDITKLCADLLRTYVSDKETREKYSPISYVPNDIHLKSSHAHELIAAFFGYKSKIALLADKKYPISRLNQAKHIIIPDVPSSIIAYRRDTLNLHEAFKRSFDGHDFQRMVRDILEEKINTLEYPYIWFGSFSNMAAHYAEEHLKNRWKALGISGAYCDDGLWKYEEQLYSDHAKLNITTIYNTGSGIDTKSHRDSKLTITIPRIAGHIGYGKAEIIPTIFSGQFRDPNYDPDFDINVVRKQV